MHDTLNKAETWRPVVGFEGLYEVSDFGRVRSVRRPSSTGRADAQVHGGRLGRKWYGGQLLTPVVQAGGYLRVDLSRARKTTNRAIHHLVLAAFVGPRPDGMEGCHNDGNRQNNRIDNLRWDTRKANLDDKIKHGTNQIGERHGNARLTEANVHEIRALRSAGKTCREIASQFGVTASGIDAVVNGRTWKHVPLRDQRACH